MIENVEEKKKIMELLTVAMHSAPLTPIKESILSQWNKRWNDFSKDENSLCEYSESDRILQDTIDEYKAKYVKTTKGQKENCKKNIEVFVENLESYRKSCEDELNIRIGKYKNKIFVKSTSKYLKRIKGNSLTRGMFDLARYSVFCSYDHKKKLYSGSYDNVSRYIDKYIAQNEIAEDKS